MDKLSREEVKELVEKISYGMGSDEEVSEWIQKIMDSVPNRNVVEAIMSGPNASNAERIVFIAHCAVETMRFFYDNFQFFSRLLIWGYFLRVSYPESVFCHLT